MPRSAASRRSARFAEGTSPAPSADRSGGEVGREIRRNAGTGGLASDSAPVRCIPLRRRRANPPGCYLVFRDRRRLIV